jgi:beta-glucosidase/6-phospho-beta-glucosidase/beta-galactosidase
MTATQLHSKMSPQPLTTQSNAICKWITENGTGINNIAAEGAIHDERELEHIMTLAFQINDHPNPGYVLFSYPMDNWILAVSILVNIGRP